MSVGAAILVGGRSSRMGATKALVEVGGTAMATLVAHALAAGGCHQVVLIGGGRSELEPLDLPVLTDLFPGEGPLGGVLTALDHFSTCDSTYDSTYDRVVVAACDLPLLDGATVARLVRAAQASDDDAVVATGDGDRQPTLAVWQTRAQDRIAALFAAGTRSMQACLDQLDVTTVPIEPSRLINVNRPFDLRRVELHVVDEQGQ